MAFILPLLGALLPAFLTAAAQSAGGAAGLALINALRPNPPDPEIKRLVFPEEINAVKWPETTKFVWTNIDLPTSPSGFTFPGQKQK